MTMNRVKRDRFLVRRWDDLLLPMNSRQCTYDLINLK